SLPAVSFETGGRETALLSMRGSCRITVGGTGHDIGLHDAIYIPRGSLVEVASEVSGDYPLQLIRYSDIARDPKLKFTAGGAATTRDLNIIVGDNVRA